MKRESVENTLRVGDYTTYYSGGGNGIHTMGVVTKVTKKFVEISPIMPDGWRSLDLLHWVSNPEHPDRNDLMIARKWNGEETEQSKTIEVFDCSSKKPRLHPELLLQLEGVRAQGYTWDYMVIIPFTKNNLKFFKLGKGIQRRKVTQEMIRRVERYREGEIYNCSYSNSYYSG